MSTEHIVRAWRDEEYREALNAEQSEILPESPVGVIDLSEDEMAEAEGGTSTVITVTTLITSLPL